MEKIQPTKYSHKYNWYNFQQASTESRYVFKIVVKGGFSLWFHLQKNVKNHHVLQFFTFGEKLRHSNFAHFLKMDPNWKYLVRLSYLYYLEAVNSETHIIQPGLASLSWAVVNTVINNEKNVLQTVAKKWGHG